MACFMVHYQYTANHSVHITTPHFHFRCLHIFMFTKLTRLLPSLKYECLSISVRLREVAKSDYWFHHVSHMENLGSHLTDFCEVLCQQLLLKSFMKLHI